MCPLRPVAPSCEYSQSRHYWIASERRQRCRYSLRALLVEVPQWRDEHPTFVNALFDLAPVANDEACDRAQGTLSVTQPLCQAHRHASLGRTCSGLHGNCSQRGGP